MGSVALRSSVRCGGARPRISMCGFRWNRKTQYQLTITTDPTPLPFGCNVIPEADSFFDVFTVVPIQATSEIGSPHFIGWTGAITSSNPNETVMMDGPKSVTAHFGPPNTEVLDWKLIK